jgi:succinate dehydrogenase / fumarate reductase, iron-sulfur subunit
MSSPSPSPPNGNPPKTFNVRVLRQDAPLRQSYWQRFRVDYEPDMNCISVLQKIAERPVTIEGKRVAPVVWECNCLEEVCGACTMLVNGRVRQACTALVDQLIGEERGTGTVCLKGPSGASHKRSLSPFLPSPFLPLSPFPRGEIELRPMTKFPVVRDLMVDRSRIFASLEKVRVWLPVDGYLDMGPGLRQSQDQQQMAYLYSKCMSCGCCLEACPQFLKIELVREETETTEAYHARLREANLRAFMGAHAIAQVELFNSNPIGAMTAGERLDALIAEGGVQVCGNAQNCVKVCPKEIPLTTAIARAGRAATGHILKKWLDR